MLSGNCLCGDIAFEVHGPVTDIYQCHCSVCRQSFGSSGASVCLCSGNDFRWVRGEDLIKIFVRPSGYRSVFCQNCGSHVPDPNPDKSTYWIPAGLLQSDDLEIKVGAHVYTGSKATWDVIGDEGVQFEEGFPA